MTEKTLRRSGIDIIGDVPWGSHFSVFYQTKQDLLDMLIPFIRAGLESNELCYWVVSDSLDEREAREAVRRAIPDFDSYHEKGQIEIVSYKSWYLRNGELYLKEMIGEWMRLMENAVSRGFDGLRGTGDLSWLEEKDWESLLEYEESVNDGINERVPIIFLCSFALPRCRASDVIDVVNRHQFALLHREGRWEMVETSRHRKTEQALRDSEERFRVLTETAACGLIVIEDERICYANPAAESITGYSRDELLKMKLGELIHPDCRGFLRREKSAEKQRLAGQEIEIVSRDGQEKWVFFSCGDPFIQGRQVILGTFYDITDRKMATEAVQQQLYRAQKLEAVGKLAGWMAHEINNQLTVIQACLDLYTGDDSFSFARSKIGRAVEKASQLNRHLLLCSKQKVHSKEPVDLNQNLKDLRKMFNRVIGEDVAIRYKLSEDLWMVNADPDNIEQVIINLILNARDAMPQGGTITISTKNVAVDREDDLCQAVCLSVSDTGVGMDESTLSQIFEPFFTTKEAGKGTGLGLTVVKGIVEAHGGWIDVQSKPGEGSTFNIYLPATNVVSCLPGINSAGLECFRGNGAKILLVEDDPDVLTLTRKVLVDNGYTVSMCRKAGEAIELFERNKGDFDLVVSDLVLPDGRGLVLVQHLRERKPELKALLVSGYPESRIDMSEVPPQEYSFLPKPYTTVELLRKKVNRLIGDRSAPLPVPGRGLTAEVLM